MSDTKLVYFDGRGRGEIIRLALVYLGIEFTEEYLTEKCQWEKLRKDGKLLFHQVPMLEIDGERWTQTNAILRYLARRGDIYGNSIVETSRIDELFDGSRDFVNNFLGIGFMEEETVLKEAESKVLPRYLPVFNKVLEETGTGYLVGSSITLADLGLLEPLLFIVEYLGAKTLEGFPAVQKFYNIMTENGKISAFLNGPHRKPKNTQAYVDNVRKVLY